MPKKYTQTGDVDAVKSDKLLRSMILHAVETVGPHRDNVVIFTQNGKGTPSVKTPIRDFLDVQKDGIQFTPQWERDASGVRMVGVMFSYQDNDSLRILVTYEVLAPPVDRAREEPEEESIQCTTCDGTGDGQGDEFKCRDCGGWGIKRNAYMT